MQLLLALLAIDGAFVVLHAAHVRYDRPTGGMWLLSRDGGFSEWWQYSKEATIVGLLFLTYRRYRSMIYLAWAAVFGYFLVDDSMKVHEGLGDLVAEGLGLGEAFGVEARDVGQILVSGSVGLFLVAGIVATTMVDRTPARRLTAGLSPVLLAIGFFGVVADVIDVIDVLGLVEDGGEMVAMTLAAVVTWEHRRHRSDAETSETALLAATIVTGNRT